MTIRLSPASANDTSGRRRIVRLMVANRAEIASRVFRTCRTLGISTVAIHSDADAGLPYVREADVAVRLPGNTPAETYLDVAAVLARRQGLRRRRDPPGLRLPLRERRLRPRGHRRRADLGRPDARVDRRDGLQDRRQGADAEGRRPDPGGSRSRRPRPTCPLLVKASAGGGGRGMRIVRALADLDREIAAAQAEAESAFGDGTVFVEPYVERGRHVEVQVVGTSVYGDRDCSLQRRHQKVVEEAPAPGLSEEVRAALHDAARRAAEAIDYRGAGTVEFLYDPATERFWFLEMNTRLQVEHPVTELVHGVDLVELQLAAAEADWTMGWPDPPRGPRDRGAALRRGPGRRLPAAERHAHAVRHPPRARHPGRLRLRDRQRGVDALRRDAGQGRSRTRRPASRPRASWPACCRARGSTACVTNRDQLVAVLRDERFLSGEVSTDLLPLVDPSTELRRVSAAQAAALALAEADRARRGPSSRASRSPGATWCRSRR